MNDESEPVSRWGTVEIQNAVGMSSPTTNSGDVRRTITQSRYTWRPPPDLAAELPSERGSVMLTSNLPFSQWTAIFKDPMTTAAAIDRLVHHSVIVELNVTSYRLETAKGTKTSAEPEPAATK